MAVNHVPKLSNDNPTGCCPRFNPKEWDGKTFEFKAKPFVRMTTRSFLYMPLNLGSQMTRTWAAIVEAKADTDEFVALSYDRSPWQAEHSWPSPNVCRGKKMSPCQANSRLESSRVPTKTRPNGVTPWGQPKKSICITRHVPSVAKCTAKTTSWPSPKFSLQDPPR